MKSPTLKMNGSTLKEDERFNPKKKVSRHRALRLTTHQYEARARGKARGRLGRLAAGVQLRRY